MSRCRECPAFAKCTVTYRGSACAALRFTYGLDSDPEAIKTNADHIRSMSDKELARFLAEVENRRSAAGGGAIWKGAAHALEWLRQPVKEEPRE